VELTQSKPAKRSSPFLVWPILLANAATCATADSPHEFALLDGDTVVFLGDSITAARSYGQIIENYTLLRYPDRNIRFFNAGKGGDTAAGGVARLQHDVFNRKATVLTVAYGVNDIVWGVHADDEHQQKYLDSIHTIITECQKRDIRVFICSAAITAENPDKSESGFLQQMCDRGLAIARDLNSGVIDVQRSMREVQRRVRKANQSSATDAQKVTLHTTDGVHLNELGQLAMAFAILKGLGAPTDISAATLDFKDLESVKDIGCRVSHVNSTADSLEFTRLDEGLPINFGLFGALKSRFVPFKSKLNRYMLTVRNLPKGHYKLTVDDRGIGTYRHNQLAQGINISSSTVNAWQPGGPWDAQSTSLQELTQARSRLAVAELMWDSHLKGSKQRPAIGNPIAEIDDQLRELQRTVARPIPYRFRLKKMLEEM